MKTMIVAMLLALLLIPNIAIADTVKLIENTDRCKYDAKLDKDYCYSIYEICDDIIFDSKDLSFDFKDENGISAISKLSYVAKETKVIDTKCRQFKIEGWKNPYINIDNIPCYKGYCFKEYAWWNTSFLHKLEINITLSAGSYTMPFLINDSYVHINDTANKQIIWCNYTGNTTNRIEGYFYWTNSSLYRCVDRTQTYAVEMNVDEGNETSYLNPFDKNLFIGSHLAQPEITAYDISIYENDCSKTGNPLRIKAIIGYGADLDGAGDYYDCTDIDAYTNNMSLMIWVNLQSLPNINMPLITKWSGGGFQPFMLNIIRSGSGTNPLKPQFQGNGFEATGSTILTSGKWYHITGTRNETHVCIYVNGALENCNLITGNVTYNAIPIYVGNDITNNYLDAYIDEFRLYNRTLEHNEIRALYENQNGTFNIVILGNQSNINVTPRPPAPLSVTLTCDICKELPIRQVYCYGNNKITIRERTTCTIDGCFSSNQTDILYCAYGCEDNLTSIGAECIPTTFETFYTGWGLFIIALIALLFISFKLKQKKRKNQRFL